MDKEMLEQFQFIIHGMADMEKRIVEQVDIKIQESESRINIKMESEITKRIDSLFDGYKLVHEKQWELERQTESLKEIINELQARLSVLESKIA